MTDPTGPDSGLVDEGSDTFYSSTGSSPPCETPFTQLECHLFGTAEEELGADLMECPVCGMADEDEEVPGPYPFSERIMRFRADELRDRLCEAAAAIGALEGEGWAVWIQDRALQLAHPTLRFRSLLEMWDYLGQIGADLRDVRLLAYPMPVEAPAANEGVATEDLAGRDRGEQR